MSNSATPWTVAHQAPLSMGFSRQEYWRGLPWLPPEDLLDPGNELTSLMSPALAGRFFTTCTTWEAHLAIHRNSVPTPALKTSHPFFFINKSPILLSCLEFQEHGAILESCGLRLLCAQTLEPVSSLSSASSSAIGLCAGYLSFSASASLSTN